MKRNLGKFVWQNKEAAKRWKSSFEKDMVAKYWDAFEREAIFDFSNTLKEDMIKDLIIDVGCGQGKYFRYFNDSSLKVGGDVSIEMLRICKEDFPGVKCVVLEGESLPFKDESFDIVLCTRTLQHIKNQKLFLEELTRITSPQGHILLLFYNALTPHCLYKNICNRGIMISIYNKLPKLLQKAWLFRPWPLEYDNYSTLFEVKNILRKNTVQVRRIRGVTLGFTWIFMYLPPFKLFRRKTPKVVSVYLKICEKLERVIRDKFPFYLIMDKVLVHATKK